MVPVAAHAGDDSANTDENVGVDEAKDLNNAASDAGKKHFWNPGGQAIEKDHQRERARIQQQ